MPPNKVSLAVITMLTMGVGVANAQNSPDPQLQTGNLFSSNLGAINQCYHGASQSDPCIESPFEISELIRGHWTAVRNPLRPEDPIPPWSIEFHPNGVFDAKNGTISMSTIGPVKTGKYRIVVDYPDDTAIYVDMDDGSHYRAGIALYGAFELLLVDESGTTTFHRVL